MKLGIKVGLQPDNIANIERTHTSFVEVWFDIARKNNYTALFEQLRQRHLEVGIHFWGTLDDSIEVNISYADPTVLKESRRRIRECLDIAARHSFQYVNIHPGGNTLTKIDFIKEQFVLTGQSKNQTDCEYALEESLRALTSYAVKHEVQLIVESIPPFAPGSPWYSPKGRTNPVRNDQMPVAALERLIPKIPSLGFANDLCHTAANIITDSRDEVFHFLQHTTEALRLYTKLIHIGYLIPPYIGTDYHGDMYDPIANSQDAVPNTSELQRLLHSFQSRDDIYALVEPHTDHIGNYLFIQKLLKETTI